MTLEELRNRIDVLDRQLVELLNERARAALLIGHLKAATSLPVYEPAREKVIYQNVRANNKGPLPDIERFGTDFWDSPRSTVGVELDVEAAVALLTGPLAAQVPAIQRADIRQGDFSAGRSRGSS